MGFIRHNGKVIHTSEFNAVAKIKEEQMKHTVKIEDVNKAYEQYKKAFKKAEKLKEEYKILNAIYQEENNTVKKY